MHAYVHICTSDQMVDQDGHPWLLLFMLSTVQCRCHLLTIFHFLQVNLTLG